MTQLTYPKNAQITALVKVYKLILRLAAEKQNAPSENLGRTKDGANEAPTNDQGGGR